MKVVINGEWNTIDPGSIVSDLIRLLDIADSRGIAIALDDEVVPRSEWKETEIRDGQKIEIVRAVQGG